MPKRLIIALVFLLISATSLTIAFTRYFNWGKVKEATDSFGLSEILDDAKLNMGFSITAHGCGNDKNLFTGLSRIEISSLSNDLTITKSPTGAAASLPTTGIACIRKGDTLTLRILPFVAQSAVVGIPSDNIALGVKSLSGTIEVTGPFKSIEASSMSGDIHASGSAEQVQLQTKSGDIAVEGGFAALTLKSVSGDLKLRDSGTLKNLQASSISGDISLMTPQAARSINTNSTSGTVQNNLPPAAESTLDISMSTVSGDISLKAPQAQKP